MEMYKNESLTCSKCGHVFNECEKDYLVLCPSCKRIKRIDFTNIEG